jgi:hypothetical protein
MFIAVDDLHRLWIAPGHSITPGTIYRVASDGSVLEAYFYGDNIRGVTCQDGKIAITGKWQPNSNASFLVVGTPQP